MSHGILGSVLVSFARMAGGVVLTLAGIILAMALGGWTVPR